MGGLAGGRCVAGRRAVALSASRILLSSSALLRGASHCEWRRWVDEMDEFGEEGWLCERVVVVMEVGREVVDVDEGRRVQVRKVQRLYLRCLVDRALATGSSQCGQGSSAPPAAGAVASSTLTG